MFDFIIKRDVEIYQMKVMTKLPEKLVETYSQGISPVTLLGQREKRRFEVATTLPGR